MATSDPVHHVLSSEWKTTQFLYWHCVAEYITVQLPISLKGVLEIHIQKRNVLQHTCFILTATAG